MIKKLVLIAEKKAGTQSKLAKMTNVRSTRLSDIKNGRRKPDVHLIMQLAEIAGLNPVETLLKVMCELEPENKTDYMHWSELSGLTIRWHARRELNPRPSASEADTLSN